MSFSESVWLELFKAVFTAVFVAGGAAIVVWRFQARNDDRRAARERELDDAARERDIARSEFAKLAAERLQIEQDQRSMKTTLITKASDLAGGFYFLTQRRMRKRADPNTWGPVDDAGFDDAYVMWASKAEAFEQELGIWYGWNGYIVEHWHQVRDLLTVRYFSMRDRNTPNLRANNAASATRLHTGLTAEQLDEDSEVLTAYRKAMPDLLQRMLLDEITL